MYDGLFKIIPALAGGAPRPDAFAAAGALQQPSRTPRAVGSRPPSRTRLGPGSDPARTLGRRHASFGGLQRAHGGAAPARPLAPSNAGVCLTLVPAACNSLPPQELYLLDLCFLAGTPRPTLATLHEDSKHQRYLKTHEVSVRDKALSDGPWPQVDCSMYVYVYRPTPSSSPEAAPRSEDLRTCLAAGCRRGVGVAAHRAALRRRVVSDSLGSSRVVSDSLGSSRVVSGHLG